MPIIGLTSNIQPRFPRLGKLRKGGERVEKTGKDGKKYLTYGEDLDHFRFTSDDPGIMRAFKDAYGEKPVSIPCYVPYEKPEEAFPVWAELWGASGLVHRCDGQNMTIWLDGDRYVNGSKPCTGGHKDGDPKRDAVGRLSLILPDLIAAGHVGYVTLETHSLNDILGILSVLQAAYLARRDLRGILFNLRRVQESITTPGFGDRKGQRSRTNKWLVRLEPAADWVQMQLEMARVAQMSDGAAPALPAGDVIDGQAVDGETGEMVMTPVGYVSKKTWDEHAQRLADDADQTPAILRDIEKATAMTTPKGTRFGDLTVEQIKVVEAQTTNDEFRKAANRLLAEPPAVLWEQWAAVCEEAARLHIDDAAEPPAGVTTVELWRMMAALKDKVAAAIPF